QAVHQSNSQFASSWPVKAYAHHQGSVVASCQGPGGQSGYVVFDSLLTVTYSTTATSQSTTPTGITCDPGGRVTFVTTGLSKANEFSFAGLHNTNLGETLKEGKDVGVVSCSVLSAYLFTNTSTPGIGC